MECGELLYGRFSFRLKGAVYMSYVWLAMLYENETWCLNESEMGILRRTGGSMMRIICGVLLNVPFIEQLSHTSRLSHRQVT